jgi:hypothetical protein
VTGRYHINVALLASIFAENEFEQSIKVVGGEKRKLDLAPAIT